MNHVINYAAYPTSGIKVGRDVFADYVKRHINHLKAANNAAYTTIINETETLYNKLFEVISVREQNFNERISLTQSVKTIRKLFNKLIDELEEVVVYKFHKNSAVYKEFFLHGITPYKEAPLSEILVKMELAESLALKYKADIGETYATGLKEVRVQLESEINAQQIAAGEVSNVIPGYEVLRLAIDKQLLKNVCVILIENLDNPWVVSTFFDEYLIFPKARKEVAQQGYILDIPAASKKPADISFSVDDSLLINNNGNGILYCYAAATADTAEPANMIEIQPADQIEISALSLGAPANKFLIFVNKDTTQAAQAEIILL